MTEDWGVFEEVLQAFDAAIGEDWPGDKIVERGADGTVTWALPLGRWTSKPWRDPHGVAMVPTEHPCIYRDELGRLRVNVPEVLKISRLEATPARTVAATRMVIAIAQAAGGRWGGVLTT